MSRWTWALGLALLVGGLVWTACDDAEETDGDGDTDVDSDGDVDGDVDADSDAG